MEAQKVAPSVREWTVEKVASLTMLEAESISIEETALCCLKEQQKQELLPTFKALSKEEKVAMLTWMTGVGVDDGKKTEEEGKAEEDGEEAKILNNNDD